MNEHEPEHGSEHEPERDPGHENEPRSPAEGERAGASASDGPPSAEEAKSKSPEDGPSCTACAAQGRRLGVFVCHCGGNISDYVDVKKVADELGEDGDVVVSKTHMFACSDAAQEEMIKDIEERGLDGIVVASCSPKLHLFTFRAMADRAGLNRYEYSQANIREQCSWAHRGNVPQATDKATRIVRAGLAKTRLSKPLETIRIETKRRVLVIGAGVAGLAAALNLADMGLTVFLIEREPEVGGWTGQWGKLFPHGRGGRQTIEALVQRVKAEERITLFTGAELVEKGGTVGDFHVKVQVLDHSTVALDVGAIVVATGFDPYEPTGGEYGCGIPGVVTLPEFERLLQEGDGPLVYDGKRVRTIGYVYCVGSRQSEELGFEKPNTYCSRFCCSAAVNVAIRAHERDPAVNQVHLYRDMRTYGKYELLYEEASRKGSVFIRFEPETPPEIYREDDGLLMKVTDSLDAGAEIEILVDLVVLVTGMVPRENSRLVDVLKLPLGKDGFFNEIHPKLRPVETVIDGVFIAGTSQGPKTISESVASSLAAVSKSAALVMKGYVDLDPYVATIQQDKCTGCTDCIAACPYGAIEMIKVDGEDKARVQPALCKGGGPCVPVCPEDAIDLEGYTDEQIRCEIDALLQEVS